MITGSKISVTAGMTCVIALGLLVMLAGSTLFAQFSQAQTPRTTQMQAAIHEMNTGSYETGITMMTTLLEEHPDLVAAWISLGRVQRQKSDMKGSLTTFTKAVNKNSGNAILMFQLGIAHGYMDEVDAAFYWLHKVKETNLVNMTSLDALPVASHLKKDSRYEGLFPTEEEFADPFVEGTRIIHEWRGENSGDQFAWIARNIGDVDGDGVNDLVASAPTNSENGTSTGKIYVYSGRSGELLWSKKGTIVNGQLGNGVEAAGDVNADGIPDVIAGAPFANRTYVYSGNNGEELLALAGPDSTGGYGNAVKGIGDINGDGHGDLLIGEPFQIFGAPFNGGSIQMPGRAYVVSGMDGATILTLKGEKDGHGFGTAVSGATSKGVTYFVIGAPGAGETEKGRVYIYRATQAESVSNTPLYTVDADESGSRLGGMFLSVVGDINADGTPDIYASDFSDAALGPSTGRVYILSGRDGTRLFVLGGEAATEGYGIGISDAGDVDGDGFDDLVIGAWQHAGAAPSGGKVYVHSGKDGSILHTITGKVPGETLGFDTTGMGDIDGDGTIDFLLTSAWSRVNGFQSGRMFVVSGSNTP